MGKPPPLYLACRFEIKRRPAGGTRIIPDPSRHRLSSRPHGVPGFNHRTHPPRANGSPSFAPLSARGNFTRGSFGMLNSTTPNPSSDASRFSAAIRKTSTCFPDSAAGGSGIVHVHWEPTGGFPRLNLADTSLSTERALRANKRPSPPRTRTSIFRSGGSPPLKRQTRCRADPFVSSASPSMQACRKRSCPPLNPMSRSGPPCVSPETGTSPHCSNAASTSGSDGQAMAASRKASTASAVFPAWRNRSACQSKIRWMNRAGTVPLSLRTVRAETAASA